MFGRNMVICGTKVMSSSMMSTNFMCSERNTAKPPFCPDGEDHSVE